MLNPIVSRFRHILGVFTLVLGTTPSFALAQEPPAELLLSSNPSPRAQAAFTQATLPPQTARARAVEINTAVIQRILDGEPTTLRIPFFPDAVATVLLEPLPPVGEGRPFRGIFLDPAQTAEFLLVIQGKAILAQWTDHETPSFSGAPGRILRLEPTSDDQVYAVELDSEKFPECGVNSAFAARAEALKKQMTPPAAPISSAPQPNNAAIEIDIAVLWTTTARTNAGGLSQIQARVTQAITEGNTALGASGITARLNLVYQGEAPDYPDGASFNADLDAITIGNDGVLDQIPAIRNITRADLVALLRGTSTEFCGLAWLLTDTSNTGSPNFAHSVTAIDCIPNRTFIHEVGHNVGCQHARADGGAGRFSYSFGHKFTGVSNNIAYRTVMALAPGTRINQFSNPNVFFAGTATGVFSTSPNAADNTLTWENSYQTIQSYRARLSANAPLNLTVGPTALTMNTTSVSPGGTLNVTSTIVVGNEGSGTMTYNAELLPSLRGLSLLPVNGTLIGGVPVNLTLTVNRAQIPQGTHVILVRVTASNGQVANIPVTINVSPNNNDLFANRTIIPSQGGSFFYSTVGAGVEQGEFVFPPPGQTSPRTLWWVFSPSTTGNWRISTVGSRSDTFVSVWTGPNILTSLTNVANSAAVLTEVGSLGPNSPFSSPGQLELNLTAGQAYYIQAGTHNNSPAGGAIDLHVYPTFTNVPNLPSLVYEPTGQVDALFNSLNIGSRTLDNANQNFRLTIPASNRTRIFGFIEDRDRDLRYQDIGGDLLRASFDVRYSGPGDSLSSTLAAQVPNFRYGLRSKSALNAVMEVNHNVGVTDAENRDLARELGPTKSTTNFSRYHIEFDPIGTTYLENSTTEGIQRFFELVSIGTETPAANGTLIIGSSTVSRFPPYNLAGIQPVKVYSIGGSSGSADFNNSSIIVRTFGVTRDQVIRYLTGSPNPADYYDDSRLTITSPESGMIVLPSQTNGIVFNTLSVPTNRMALATVDFVNGNNSDRTLLAERVRSSAGVSHIISFRLRSDQASNTVPTIRLRARTAKFAWSQKLELLGAKTMGSVEGRLLSSQILPGQGSQANLRPGTMLTNAATNQFWYHLIFPSPLDPLIRPDRTGGLTNRFPLLANQPGPGVEASSRRDILLGIDLIDSFSLGSGFELEQADNIRLNRIEIRQVPTNRQP